MRQRVIDGERRILAQLALVDWLARTGHATENAEVHLKLMLNIVHQMRGHLREMRKDEWIGRPTKSQRSLDNPSGLD